MSRALIAWVAASLAVVGMGCTMCQHPYDYSGPVVTGGRPEPGHCRVGSVLSEVQQPMPDAGVDGRTVASRGTSEKSERSSIVEETPVRIDGRKTDGPMPNGWRSDLPSALPQSLSPRNGRSQ